MTSSDSDNVVISQRGMDLVIERRWFGNTTILRTIFAIGFIVSAGFMSFGKGSSLVPIRIDTWSVDPFSLFFLAIGAFLLYVAATEWLNRTTMVVSRSGISVRHGPLPWPGNKVVSAVGFKRLHVVSSWLVYGPRRNQPYTFGVFADTADLQRTKLAGGFTRDDANSVKEAIEKQWAIQQPKWSPPNAAVLDRKAPGSFQSGRPPEQTPAGGSSRRKRSAKIPTLREVISVLILILLLSGTFIAAAWIGISQSGFHLGVGLILLPLALAGLWMPYVCVPWAVKVFRERARQKHAAAPNKKAS